MINRIYANPDVINSKPTAKNGTAPAVATGSFAAVYGRMQELRTAATNQTSSSMAAQTVETAPSYSSVYAPGSGGVFAPRLVDLEDPKATMQKLEELQKDIREKGLSGFFDKMDDNECYAYLYERYADTFGANFMDYQWQQSAKRRVPNESDLAKSAVARAFNEDKWCAFAKSDDWNWKNIGSEHNLANRNIAAFSAYFGYGDMTTEERYQAILSDYAASGDPSYAASFKLMWLLHGTGCLDSEVYKDTHSLLASKMRGEYAALDMTVTDMAKSRYANALYGFDAAAYLLGMVDYIQNLKETSIVFNYDPKAVSFFEKLSTDLRALGGAMAGIF